MLAFWCHQVPVFFLHHLENQSSSASEGGPVYRRQREQYFPVLCRMHPCEDAAGVLCVPECSWSAPSHLCFSLQKDVSFTHVHSFGASLSPAFHWQELNPMDSCHYKGTRKVQSFSGTLPSQISLLRKKGRMNEYWVATISFCHEHLCTEKC